jgi:hypothetical protein
MGASHELFEGELEEADNHQLILILGHQDVHFASVLIVANAQQEHRRGPGFVEYAAPASEALEGDAIVRDRHATIPLASG